MRDDIEKALQTLNSDFGTSLFTNPRQFKAALADTPIEPNAKKIRKLLNIAICDMKAYSRLESGLANNNLFIVNNLIAEMVSDHWPEESSAQMAIESIAGLLGYPPASPSQPKIATAQQHLQLRPTPTMNDPLLERAFLFLEDGDWDKADEYCERVLDANPKNAAAYVGKLCAELKIKNEADLANQKRLLDDMPNYKKALRFADTSYHDKLVEYNQAINDRIIEEQERLKKLKVGDIVKFGSYDWRMLEIDKQNGKALILSDKIIEQRKYNKERVAVTWETCTLRNYLNGEFLQKFTKEQQGQIIQTRIANNDNQWYDTKGGSDTSDSVFLLSLEEVVNYFGDSGQLRNKNLKDKGRFDDQYNAERIAKNADGKACWWWLRSPGYGSSDAARVNDDGVVGVSGRLVNDFSGGVRPALWLNL